MDTITQQISDLEREIRDVHTELQDKIVAHRADQKMYTAMAVERPAPNRTDVSTFRDWIA